MPGTAARSYRSVKMQTSRLRETKRHYGSWKMGYLRASRNERKGGACRWRMAESEADRCRKKAEECRRLAEKAVSALDKETWLRVADEWLKLAQLIDSRSGPEAAD
jgi:hypothetical protein